MHAKNDNLNHWLDRPVLTNLTLNWESLLFTLIILLAFLTRFYDLETRVMSHDENSHVYYSWRLAEGQGYQHTPLTHGPLLFHLTAFSYFLFGDNDFTARIPFALFSIATIGFLWWYRRYLGRVGALIAAFLMLISPFMLFYGRYVRNEAFVGLFGVITLWAILRYLETGEAKFTYWLTAATTWHFIAKETSFIYTAQALVFLGLYFVWHIIKHPGWKDTNHRNAFVSAIILAILILAVGIGVGSIPAFTPENTPSAPDAAATGMPLFTSLALALSALSILLALYFAIKGLTWDVLKKDRAFSLLILLFSLVLPHLTAFPVRMVGWDPLDYQSLEGITRIGVFLLPLALASVGLGLAWNPRLWLVNAAIFYIPFTILYTTFFTWGNGFFSGLIGSLGYWLEQQGVQRGSQPWYYYILVQIPVYEFLPALGSVLAGFLVLNRSRQAPSPDETDLPPELESESPQTPTLALLGFWVVTSLLAYTIAGEKMPWLTVHIAWPMILLTGWALGQIVENTNWEQFRKERGYLFILLMLVFVLSLSKMLASLLGPTPPFQGKELAQLNVTNSFLLSLLVAIASGWSFVKLLNQWDVQQVARVSILTLASLLGILTMRTAFRAAYINYDNATEYLVYAHSASGPKKALAQIEEISQKTTDGLNLVVAYDDETTYPFWWYLRNYPNQKYYGANPTRELREAPVILVGDNNFTKIEPVVGQAYYQFDYIRIWWPNQDYYDLNWERIRYALTNPDMRQAIFEIWFNRDYTKYAEIKGRDMSLPNWEPSDRMRIYVRKDIAAKVWNFGASPVLPEEIFADPYEGKGINLPADKALGSEGTAPGKFKNPRDIALAPDGTLYVADTGNHRIQHLSPDGEVLQVWGTFSNSAENQAPPGTFYEPWGIAVGPDGSVYVADTWNHRVQKFTAEGQFITQWGYFGQGESGAAFWGPRDILVSPDGRVFVSDTGNKRIAVFDPDGNFITQFGSPGLLKGQFDEPVGIAIGPEGKIFVADTWNQRVQVFKADENGLQFTPLRQWDIIGWYGQSLDNKPYLAVDDEGYVYVSDPEGYRILQFNTQGEFLRYWGEYGSGMENFTLPTGLAAGTANDLWVADSGNHRILHFTLPPVEQSANE